MLELNFSPFPELRSERLFLRRLVDNDAPEMFFIRSNNDVLRFIGKEPMKTLDEAAEFIKQLNHFIDTNESVLWAICLKENPEQLIGTICLWNIRKENYRAEIGYILHPGYWGRGLITEAISIVVDYGFHTLNLHSIDAMITAGNDASVATLEKNGFIKEGHLKEDIYFGGKFFDTLIYSKINASHG